MATPPAVAEAAYAAPVSNLFSRVEIYEADGVTHWLEGAKDDRLMGGSVTVDYSRTERRAFELEFDNSDFGLENTPGQFWYDKILKVYTGIEYDDFEITTSYVYNKNLCSNPRLTNATTNWNRQTGGATVTNARETSAGSPIGNTAYRVNLSSSPTTLTNLGIYFTIPTSQGLMSADKIYSFFIYAKGTGYTPALRVKVDFLNEAGTVQGTVYGDTTVASDGEWISLRLDGVTSPVNTTRVRAGVFHDTGGTTPGAGDIFYATGCVIEESETSRRFFDGAVLDFGNRQYYWDGTADASTSTEQIEVTSKVPIHETWETQIGEFLIDTIKESHFPYTMKVTGRDNTKRCLTSKFVVATAYSTGTAIETAIQSIASAAGVTKFLLPLTGHSLGTNYVFERGNNRWDAMTQIATSFGYDLYFDEQGYLVLEEQKDPLSAPLIHTLSTGIFGNLVTYEKSTTDSRIYNHIVVNGETQDINVPPVWAEATNTEPSSPTNISKLGDRVYQYTSSFIITETQAQDVADKFLQIHSLEQFDLNFGSISAPWLDVGTIIEFDDPRPSAGQPTRFLLSTLNIPLGLEAMSGTAKRVSVVG